MSRSPSWGPSRSGSALGAPLSARGGTAKPKLPRLQPHVNKKAQSIIAAHLNLNSSAFNSVDTVSSGFSYDTSGPVLAQLDSTAPKTARTHDISHLCDKGHTLIPKPPESLIDEKDHVYEVSFLPTGPLSVYSDVDGMWHTKVFPSSAPSSRTDAVMLDNWITTALARHQEEALNREVKEDLAQSVQSLVPILSVALHEVVRQVTHHCTERGATLEKIWRVYVELFQRVLKQMQQALVEQKTRTDFVQGELNQAKEELRSIKAQHPIEMHRVITELEASFTEQQERFEMDLEEADEDNGRLKSDIKTLTQELATWYPGFERYKESYIKHHVPDVQAEGKSSSRRRSSANTTAMAARRSQVIIPPDPNNKGVDDGNADVPPEIAIAKDFKRLLAVLAPEKRKLIGQELSSVMDPNKADKDARKQRGEKEVEEDDPEEQTKIQELKLEVLGQEARIRALRDEIAKLEAEQVEHEHAEQHAGRPAWKRFNTEKSAVTSLSDSTPAHGLEEAMSSLASRGSGGLSLKSKMQYAIEAERKAEMKQQKREDDVGSSDASGSDFGE